MFFKKMMVLLILLGFIATGFALADPLGAGGMFSLGAWIYNSFSVKPQNWITPIGAVDIRITVSVEDQPKMGVESISPLWHGQDDEKNNTRQVNLIRGWGSEVSCFFPTGPKDAREIWYRFDSGKKQKFLGAPLRLKIPEPADDQTHSLEMGVSLGGNSWGSVMIIYRFRTLGDYYAESLADNQRFGQLMRDEYVKEPRVGKEKPAEATTSWVKVCLVDEDYNLIGGQVVVKQKTATVENYHTLKILPDGGRVVVSITGERGRLFKLREPFIVPIVQLAIGTELWFKPMGCGDWVDHRKIEKLGETEMVMLRRKGGQ